MQVAGSFPASLMIGVAHPQKRGAKATGRHRDCVIKKGEKSSGQFRNL